MTRNIVVLEFQDGSKDILLPPSLIDLRGRTIIRRHVLIKEWHRLLLQELTTQECLLWGPEQDEICYPIAQPYYEKIWELLGRSLKPGDPQHLEQLLPEIRHRLFVGTEPVQRNEKWIIGLSQLEALLGQQILSDEQVVERSDSDRTTGSEELDILTSTLLVFKRKGFDLALNYGADELHKMCGLANQLLTPSDDDKGKKTHKVESDIPDAIPGLDKLTTNKDAILKGLSQIGEIPPGNF